MFEDNAEHFDQTIGLRVIGPLDEHPDDMPRWRHYNNFLNVYRRMHLVGMFFYIMKINFKKETFL